MDIYDLLDLYRTDARERFRTNKGPPHKDEEILIEIEKQLKTLQPGSIVRVHLKKKMICGELKKIELRRGRLYWTLSNSLPPEFAKEIPKSSNLREVIGVITLQEKNNHHNPEN